jgi:hypothetical protein
MTEMTDAETESLEHRPVFEHHHRTGLEIKEKAGIPADYSLYRRMPGDNEPISNEETVDLHDGEHFFSRPPSNVS